MIYNKEKYCASGPQFYGTANSGKSTNGIVSLKGNATPQTMVLAQNINGVGGAFGASGFVGMAANWLGYGEAQALGDERDLRIGFCACVDVALAGLSVLCASVGCVTNKENG